MKESAPAPVPHEDGKEAFSKMRQFLESGTSLPSDPEELEKAIVPSKTRGVKPAQAAKETPRTRPVSGADAYARWEQEQERNEKDN